jgi:hypothetical protein
MDKGADIMKTRIMLGALIMAAVIGSSVGVGYAGSGGGGGGGIDILLQCYGIAPGVKPPPHVLDIDDQFTNSTEEKVGKLKLVCTFTTFSPVNPDVAPLNPVPQQTADHFTCYEVSQAQATTSVVTLRDAFWGENGQTVTVQGSSKYVCVQATKECIGESGCPVIPQ